MKCDRCGEEESVADIGDYELCENCLADFKEFMNECRRNKAYFTVMYE